MNPTDVAGRMSATSLAAIGFALVLICGILDYLSGPELAFSIFYLLPIVWVTWFAGLRVGISLSLFATVMWLVADVMWDEDNASLLVPYWNALVRLVIFMTVTFLLSTIKQQQRTLEQKVEEKTADLVRLNRVHVVLSNANQAIIRIQEEQKLFDTVCRIATNEGMLHMAWIGMADDETQSVRVQSHAGSVNGYIDALDLSLAGPVPGRSPMTWAIKSGEHFVCNDIAGDERDLPWREHALRVGYAACASFPLRRKGKCVGGFSFYSGERDYFNAQELKLIDEMAEDVSFFLDLRDREERRKTAEAELKRSEEQYRSFFNDDLTGDYVTTPEGKILSCNPAFVRMFGFASHEEALSANAKSLYASPEEPRILVEKLRLVGKLEYVRLEMCRCDNTRLHIIANLIGIFDNAGTLVQIKGYLFDDTKRQQLEHQLIQAQRLDSLGTLAGGVAHDFNNILGIILGHATLLECQANNPEQLRHSIAAISKASERGSDLVRQLLTYARKTEPVLESVRINEIISEITKLAQETFPKTITITTSLASDLPLIFADSSQIYQVLLNLYINARDAMPSGGTLSVSSSMVGSDSVLDVLSQAKNVNHVKIQVSDTGIGMDDDVLNRIFEPFFTTKGPGGGSGLGLSVVYGIIENHSGFIHVSSEKGKGSVFRIFLPVQEGEFGVQRVRNSPAVEMPGGDETILFVEDEDLLRESVEAVLSSKGYTLITARDGLEAVEKFRECIQEVDVVITDLGLPQLSGEEVFRRIREIDPKARIILASGYIDPSVRAELQKSGAQFFIQKPYYPATVLKAIRDILKGNS